MNRYDHVGKTSVLIDVSAGSPWVRCIVEPGTDVPAFIARLNEALKSELRRTCIDFDFGCNKDAAPVQLTYKTEPQIIRTKAEDDAEWERKFPPRPVKSKAEWDAEVAAMRGRVQALSLKDLIDEYAGRIGGTTWDDLVSEELDKRIAEQGK